ncbi:MULTISPECIES: efflux RND transporter permease subunit [Vibrio]|uniref:efflux RND transporter permease subunit n=1 Tax=Vibrio TaxID=662 RepID=UPI00207599DB|nr:MULTISPECIES: efflux RND transporter permease subunit [Vibrio]USD31364.1 efflux RND transporter permease subunit [Vibrio sp. SCSIO 43186]USD44409.1 efflux RND transporter permease subunit [Vibrio sp. SCSIO 43145]USD68487.1 efflux RND transporter permease subunit [Vibrio sp. SCSIO 43139]USD96174.1 acriflavin resistance protein [Vibrio coralliilyticus]
MKLPEICIKHPVFASVLSIAIVLLGIVSYQKLAIQYFPERQTASASVSASITGASAEFMSQNVAEELITAVTGLDKIKTMTTDCQEGSCSLKIQFEDGISDVEYASLMNNLRSKVDGISDFPPAMTDKPTVTDDSSETSMPSNIITFVNRSSSMDKQEMFDYISQQLAPQFKNVLGVGGVWGPYGGSNRAIRVWLQPERMAALNVSASDVVGTLSTYNATFTAGTIKGEVRDFSINPVNQVTSIEDVRDLVIRVDNGNIIRVNDVADIQMGEESLEPSMLHVDGDVAMSLQVLPLKTENPVTVANRVKDAMARMEMPEGIEMKMVYNQADFIEEAIDQGFMTLVEAIVLVSAIVVLFLGSLRVAAIPLITIPVCVIGVFAVMALLGFSINVLTILAIILAIGLVVDDAIVVVENCYRHIEEGLSPFQAALKSCKEIVFPVIAMTLTLAVVYLPIGLMSGLTADLFRQFAFTLAAAVIISGFVALTLSPMMSAYMLRSVTVSPKWFQWVEVKLNAMTDKYMAYLNAWFKRPRMVMSGTAALIALSIVAVWFMPKVLLPTEDTGFIEVTSHGPAGAGRLYDLENAGQINEVFGGNDAIEANLAYIETAPTNHVLLKPWEERDKSADEVIAEMSARASEIISAYTTSFSVRSADNLDVADNLILQITTVNRDLDELSNTAEKVVKLLEDYEGLSNVDNSTHRDQLRFDLSIDRNAIVLSGVDYANVTNAISTFLGSVKAADLQADDGFTYPIQVQVNRKALGDFKVLDKLYVSSESGQRLPLSQFVSIKPVTAESNIKTYGGKDAAEITADLVPGYSADDVQAFIDAQLPELLKAGQSYEYDGVIKELNESSAGMQMLFGLALIFIFLILAAQFESFVDPLVILITVPLCLVGAILTLSVFGQSLNLYSKIGLLTLVGLVTKHGILMVEFANLKRKEGMEVMEAALMSARSRLRPILMTSLTMIIGSLPLALAEGPGSLGRVNIGLVLVGGLTIGTFFSLFFVPMTYVAVAKIREKSLARKQLVEG